MKPVAGKGFWRAWALSAALWIASIGSPAWAASPPWPPAHSDLAADPAVRFGVLANGLRYAIMPNKTPKGQVSIRMRVGVGSLDETDDEQGLAHLLEHMSFRGSTHVPESEVWTGLQRLGMSVGADASAYTQETQTFYIIDLPSAEPKTLDYGLMRMRETASEMTLDPKALDTERGPVLSEERLRDTPDFRLSMDQRAFFFKGLLLPKRAPIGHIEVIEHAQTAQMRAFYQTFYRPDLTTLILVGDVDADTAAAQIKAHFGDWSAKAPARPRQDQGALAQRGLEARIVADPKVSRAIVVGWVSPYPGPRDNRAEERRQIIEAIGLNVINRRLREMANGAAPPFIEASISRRDQAQSARLTLMAVDDAPSRWRSALRAAEIVRRQAVTFGVSQADVDLEVSRLRTQLEAAAAGAATRRTPGLAQGLLASADSGSVFTSPEQNLALFNTVTQSLTAEAASQAVREAFAGSGPLIFIAAPTAIEGGEATVTEAFKQIEAEPITPPPAATRIDWPYRDFGRPGAVVERRTIADLGVTEVRFANGVRLTIKPTEFAKDQVLVGLTIGHGLLDLPTDRTTARWAADSGAFIYGGLGKIGLEDLQRVLASKVYSLNFGAREDHFELSGATRARDLDTQMQVLAAYVTDPGLRPEAFEHVRRLANPLINNQTASPTGVMQRQLGFLLHDGDPRWAPPLPIDIATTQVADVRAVLAAPLARGPIEIAVVGDITVDKAIEAVAATFGALPPRTETAAPAAAARQVRFPAPTPTPVIRHHSGRPDQALFAIAWPVPDGMGDLQTSRDLRILEQALKSRLFTQFRIADGAAYEADTALETSQVFPGFGYIIAFAEAPPDKADLFFQAVDAITADLRQTPISTDELERARQPRVELFTRARQTNSYWLGALMGAQAEPRRLDVLRTTIPALQHVTAADVQRLASAYLTPEHAWRLRIDPRPANGSISATRTVGVARLDCAHTDDNHLTDCHVLKETPAGLGVGGTALTLAPNLKFDPHTTPIEADGRIRFDIKVQAPDAGL